MARDEEQPLIGSWIWGKMAGDKSVRSEVFGKAGQGGFEFWVGRDSDYQVYLERQDFLIDLRI